MRSLSSPTARPRAAVSVTTVRLLGALCLLGLATETGCTKDTTVNVGPNGSDAPTNDGTLSDAGGTVTNATLGASLTVDPGTLAVGEKVRFTISEARPPLAPALPATLEAATRFVAFGPADKTFARDLRLALDVPAGDLRLYRLVGTEWKPEASAVFTGGQARLSTTRLGVFVAAKTVTPVGGGGGKAGASGSGTAGMSGTGGAPVEPCAEGDIGCDDGVPWTCSDEGQHTAATPCTGGTVCEQGACVPPTIQGGSGGGGGGGGDAGTSSGTGGTSGGSGGSAGTGGSGAASGSGGTGATSGSGGAEAGGASGTAGGGGAAGGGPACELPDLVCGGTCVPVKTSQTHCGKCDNACAADQTCTDGVCACNGGATLCGSICVDLLVNASHCGACGNVCDPGVACQAGHCVSEWAQWRLPGELGAPFSYQDVDDKVVIDKVTTLQWQKRHAPAVMEWDAAMAYCDSLELGGFSDWRAPTAIELISILSYATSNPAIDPIFPGTPSARFWTRTPAAQDPGKAWIVGFKDGLSNVNDVGNDSYVRCVR